MQRNEYLSLRIIPGAFFQKEIVNFTTTRIWFFVIKLYMYANK